MKPTNETVILVVDDDAGSRQAMAALMEDRGYTVLQAASGEEGMRVMEEQPVDLVITDLNLDVPGGMDGLDVTRLVVREYKPANPNLVTVVMSGAKREDAEPLAIKAGADRFLHKPIIDLEGFMDELKALRAEKA